MRIRYSVPVGRRMKSSYIFTDPNRSRQAPSTLACEEQSPPYDRFQPSPCGTHKGRGWGALDLRLSVQIMVFRFRTAASNASLAFRFAVRELRGGLRGFGIFLACIVLGVATIAGVGSVARGLTDGIAREGQVR